MTNPTRKAIRKAIDELRTSKARSDADIEEIFYKHLRNEHSQHATTAEIKGETPTDYFYRVYPNETDDNENGGVSY
jgi:hypothetical protein